MRWFRYQAGRVVAVAAVGTVLVTGCSFGSSGSNHPSSSASATPSGSATATGGLAGDGEGGSATSAPRSTIVTTPRPSLSVPGNVAETDGSCPYIDSATFALGEGDRVGRTTVLHSSPVGCRFYFAYDASAVVGEIDLSTFATATEAYNAMVGSAKGHPEVQSDPSIGAGAVAFRTDLQGNQAWQCVFAKGRRVVIVRTRQPDPALNAFNLAREVAPKIP